MKNKLLFTLIATALLAGCGYEEAKTAIKKQLNDPDSAKFSDIVDGATKGDVCGMVNAKNRMGGYVGATPFFYSKDLGYAGFVRTPSESDFRLLWSQMKFGNFKDRFMEIAMECRTTVEWKTFCGTESPLKQHELCPLMSDKTKNFYMILKDRFDK